MLALIAPCPLFIVCGCKDTTFPRTESVRDAVMPLVREVYALHKAEDRLDGYFFDGGHAFDTAAKERAYPWLDRRLRQ
ncbi:MAG: hypothetical protein HY735_14635 [Verrucomicrobia bacterium]|nr:hypothetical protein [Verrucomicrobiota bacterium]